VPGEEVRLRFVRTREPFAREVAVRRQHATVDRQSPGA
jgi:hypothetical protein